MFEGLGQKDGIAAYHSGYRIQRTHEDRAVVDKLNRQTTSKKSNLNKIDRGYERARQLRQRRNHQSQTRPQDKRER